MDTLAEILIETYPNTASLEDGTTITLRPLLKEDEGALLAYFQSLPRGGDRLCLKEDVTDPKVIENWVYEMDYDNILPLIALLDGQIVGTPRCTSAPSAGPNIWGKCALPRLPSIACAAWGPF